MDEPKAHFYATQLTSFKRWRHADAGILHFPCVFLASVLAGDLEGCHLIFIFWCRWTLSLHTCAAKLPKANLRPTWVEAILKNLGPRAGTFKHGTGTFIVDAVHLLFDTRLLMHDTCTCACTYIIPCACTYSGLLQLRDPQGVQRILNIYSHKYIYIYIYIYQ